MTRMATRTTTSGGRPTTGETLSSAERFVITRWVWQGLPRCGAATTISRASTTDARCSSTASASATSPSIPPSPSRSAASPTRGTWRARPRRSRPPPTSIRPPAAVTARCGSRRARGGDRGRPRAREAAEARLGLRGDRVRRAPAAVRDVLLRRAADREHPHVPLVRLGARQGGRRPLPRRVLAVPTLGLINIGALATGVLAAPRGDAESLLAENGRIAALGAASRTHAARADVVIDCRGTTVVPGLVDSHCHVVLGDYTPRQKTVDFLDSYVHGGITSVVSAGGGGDAPRRPPQPPPPHGPAVPAPQGLRPLHPH